MFNSESDANRYTNDEIAGFNLQRYKKNLRKRQADIRESEQEVDNGE
jgi:hypothetical protein